MLHHALIQTHQRRQANTEALNREKNTLQNRPALGLALRTSRPARR